MSILWKDHREVFIVFFGLGCLVFGMAIELTTEETVLPYAHDIGYTIWMVCYVYWLFKITKKTRARHVHSDERAIHDHVRFGLVEEMRLKYFVRDESDHTTVNWWRKLRGKITIRLFSGLHPSGGIRTVSNVTYVVTKKQLFEMRLRGFTERAAPEVADAALTDEWMKQFRSWVK